MIRTLLIVWIVLVSSSSIAYGQETYRWVDEKGTVHFSDDLTRVPEKYRDQVRSRKQTEGPSPSTPKAPTERSLLAQPSPSPSQKISWGAMRFGGGPRPKSGMINSRMPRPDMNLHTRP